MSHWRFNIVLLAGLSASLTAHAGQVYRCVDAHGHVAFQDQRCARDARQQRLDLPAPPPASTRPVWTLPPAPASRTAPAASAPTASAPPRAVPPLYACVNTVNGEPYFADAPRPPYRAPLGMVGAIQQPLGEVYDARTGTHGSTPESMHGQSTPTLAGGNLVWVSDPCQRLSDTQACRQRKTELAEVEQSLTHAFQEDRPGLEQRRDALEHALAGCQNP